MVIDTRDLVIISLTTILTHKISVQSLKINSNYVCDHILDDNFHVTAS
jgi:hypothetical protein